MLSVASLIPSKYPGWGWSTVIYNIVNAYQKNFSGPEKQYSRWGQQGCNSQHHMTQWIKPEVIRNQLEASPEHSQTCPPPQNSFKLTMHTQYKQHFMSWKNYLPLSFTYFIKYVQSGLGSAQQGGHLSSALLTQVRSPAAEHTRSDPWVQTQE